MTSMTYAEAAQRAEADASPLLAPLCLRDTLRELKISVRTCARAVQLSPALLHTIISTGCWPKRRSIPQLREQLLGVLAEAGATPAQLESAFERCIQPPPAPHRRPPVRAICIDASGSVTSDQSLEDDIMLMPKQTLTPQARAHFKLFSNPFDGEVQSAAEMFITPEIRYVREACLQAAINARFVAVVGESGSGKTTILGDLEDRLLADRRPVMIIRPSVLGMADSDRKGKAIKSGDIQTAILQTIDPLAKVAQSPQQRATQVRRVLEESTQAGNQHLLVIEEAHDMPTVTLNHLKRLHEAMRLGRRPMLGILLLAHPELMTKLRRFDTREVMQRCEVVQLQPLDGHLREYLAHRAALANRNLDDLITGDGVEALRARLTVQRGGANVAPISLVYPLAVHNMITAALNEAADVGAPIVNADVIRAV